MKVYIAEPYATPATARLRTHRSIAITEDPGEAEILLIRSQTKIDQAFLKKTPALRLVVTATSGFDHIDWRLCEQRSVVACYTPEANAASTAELTMFLMNGLLRKTLTQIENARKGHWREGILRGENLEGKTLGIIGLGRVGQKVARLAKAYDMHLIAHDPYVDPEIFEALSIERMGLTEVLRAAEILTLHVPLTSKTKNLINLATLQELSHTAYLVNASRGSVVDESEVLVALREGRLQGAAFDVLEREPPQPGNELLRHPRAIVTPHVGAFTIQAFEKASAAAVDRALNFVSGLPVADCLPLSAPWFE